MLTIVMTVNFASDYRRLAGAKARWSGFFFDFGVYGFVAYALGKVFSPAPINVQMIAALATFSFPS